MGSEAYNSVFITALFRLTWFSTLSYTSNSSSGFYSFRFVRMGLLGAKTFLWSDFFTVCCSLRVNLNSASFRLQEFMILQGSTNLAACMITFTQ